MDSCIILFCCIFRYVLVKDVLDGPQNLFQVNYTPSYLNDVLELRHTWLSLTIILGVIFIILLCLFLALRQRITLAIKMIEHGSKAISHMLCSLTFPVLPFFLHGIVVLWFVLTGMYIASIREQKFTAYYDKDQRGKIDNIYLYLPLISICLFIMNLFE